MSYRTNTCKDETNKKHFFFSILCLDGQVKIHRNAAELQSPTTCSYPEIKLHPSKKL